MSNTLLVIGNGFDLHLGRKTSYKDYFLSDYFKEKREQIQNAYKIINGMSSVVWVGDMTCWDILFWGVSCIDSKQIETVEDYKWCDIEKIIRESLLHYTSKKNGKDRVLIYCV